MNIASGTNVRKVAVRRLLAKVDERFERTLVDAVRGGGFVLEDCS